MFAVAAKRKADVRPDRLHRLENSTPERCLSFDTVTSSQYCATGTQVARRDRHIAFTSSTESGGKRLSFVIE